MDIKNYSEARANLSKLMDRVSEDHDVVIITRQRGKPVVMLSLDEWNSWQETEYLNRSPANRAALRKAIESLERGEGVTFDSVEEAIETAKREIAVRAAKGEAAE